MKSNFLPRSLTTNFNSSSKGDRKKKKKQYDATLCCYINSVDKQSIQLACHLVGYALTDAYGTMWRNLSPELTGHKACSPT